MMQSVFDSRFEDLPAEIAIFPLPGAMLMPRGHLPLNLFEPRYLNMANDALAKSRMIGMIQPLEYQPDPLPGDTQIYETGCLGRITSFSETPDGQLLITLKGICRFNVAEELANRNGYRRITADYAAYREDLVDHPEVDVDRERLASLLKAYFKARQLNVDWSSIENADDDYLVTSLAMSCPFEVGEKQALLEAPTLAETCDILVTLMEMAVQSGGDNLAKH